MEMYRIDPEHDDPTHQSINRPQRQAGRRPAGLDAVDRRRRPRPAREGRARLPGHGQADPAGRRHLVAHPPAAQRRAGPDGHRAGRPRRRRHDGWDSTIRPTSSATPPASATTSSWRPMKVVGRHGVSLHDQWGDEPTAYLGITMPNFPNLFCIYGPGTNLAFGASLFYHAEFQVHYALEAIHETLASGARWAEVTPDGARRVRRSVSGRRSASWCGRIPPSRTATTRTPTARSSRCPRGRSTSTGQWTRHSRPRPLRIRRGRRRAATRRSRRVVGLTLSLQSDPHGRVHEEARCHDRTVGAHAAGEVADRAAELHGLEEALRRGPGARPAARPDTTRYAAPSGGPFRFSSPTGCRTAPTNWH